MSMSGLKSAFGYAMPGVTDADIQEFTTSGIWRKPVNSAVVFVECWGAGGSGGSGGVNTTGGYGGGGGAYAYQVFKASDLPSTVTVTVGAGGAARTGGAGGGTAGITGGTSSFGTYLYAYGGGGGYGAGQGVMSGGGGGGLLSAGAVNAGGLPAHFDSRTSGLIYDGLFGGGFTGSIQAQNTGFGGAQGGGNNGNAGVAGGTSVFGGCGGASAGHSGTAGAVGGGTGGGTAGTFATEGGINSYGGSGTQPRAGGGSSTSGAVVTAAIGTVVFGNNTFVGNYNAVGNYLVQSNNGINWVITPTNAMTEFGILGYGAQKWLMHNRNGVYSSNNLINWSLSLSVMQQNWTTAAYSPQLNTWVMSGRWTLGTIRSTDDGTTWTASTGAPGTLYGATQRVIWDSNNFIITVGTTTIWSSPNGASSSWTTRTAPANIVSLASNGSAYLITTANTPFALISTNAGVSWANVATTLTANGNAYFANNNWVIVQGSNVYTSTDGSVWSTASDGTADTYGGFAFGSNTYFISSATDNANAGISSPDLSVWTTRTLPTLYLNGPSGSGAFPAGGGAGGASAVAGGSIGGTSGAGANGLVRIYTFYSL